MDVERPRVRKRSRSRLNFNAPLDPAVAGHVDNYRATRTQGRGRRVRTVRVRSAVCDAAGHAVTLTLGRSAPRGPLSLTIQGLIGADSRSATIVTSLR